jgi:succinoglycan biosynthesis protein ExoA
VLIDYFPRQKPSALWRQYFKFGEGRAHTALNHKSPLKPRQLVPALIAPAVALAFLTPFSVVFALPALAWNSVCLSYGLLLGLRARSFCAAGSGIAAAIMHLAWSLGFLKGLTSSPRAPVQSPASA